MVFERVINLSTYAQNIDPSYVHNLQIINEPNNELVQYYHVDDLPEDKSTQIKYANYATAKWLSKSRRLTTRPISRMVLKHYPGIGAIAAYKHKYEGGCFILCPVNNNKTKFTAPQLQMAESDGNITFTIEQPKNVAYECFRIILQNEYFAVEYITYETTLTIPIPDVIGVYKITCIGYVSEGQTISFTSNELTLNVLTGKESFAPGGGNDSYYTKEQVDNIVNTKLQEAIGDIGRMIDRINVISV